MQPTGAARTEISIVDFSLLIGTALAGITNYLGITERGEVGKPTIVGSWDQYTQIFGGLLVDNDFPLYCKRALDAGGKLNISRAAKYTNPDDKTTITGAKSLLDVTQSAVSAAGATALSTLTAVVDGTVSIIAEVPGASNVILASAVAIVGASSITVNAGALKDAVNANTGTNGYSANNVAGAITFTAPSALGAFSNGVKIKIVVTSGITFSSYSVQMSGGNDATLSTGTLGLKANSIGIWGDDLNVTVTNAASNIPHQYDITVSLANSVLTPELYTDFPQSPTNAAWATKLADMLLRSQILGTFDANDDFVLQPASWDLASGADSDALNPLDYVGTSIGGTNLHSFDNDGTATKVAIPAIADPALDLALATWVDNRKDLMGLTRTPVGLQPSVNVDYRKGTGAYDHIPVNSWRMMMSTGGLNVLDPLINSRRDISEIGDWVGIIAQKDNNNQAWFSFAGYKRGIVNNAYGVVINVGTPALASANDDYDNNGINPVIQDGAKNILFWGNSTLYQNRASLLCKAEVAELLVFLYRFLKSVVPQLAFDPNDVDTWKTIYRNVRVGMEQIRTKRGIWKWAYDGDQDIVDVSQAVVNSSANIDAGMYKFKLYVAPKVTMKYIEITVAVTNSGVDFTSIK